tara:strand:+ start:7421 stop:8617 length:1197 start_codon:yes stop_codon:yes gene_type:complete
MKNKNKTLYLEIDESTAIFLIGQNDDQNNFKIIYKLDIKTSILIDNRISDYEKTFNILKENIFLIEKKFDCTFNEIVIILENFKPTFVNLSGYKKLNGSQVLRENITYILNTLKSYVDKTESKKKILHIFNSKFELDKKTIDNLPIGLFGDFYSHELSFILINTNDFKNIENILGKCNLKIKKILLKSFIKGAFLSEKNKDIETFFQISINDNSSKIFYFENNALKFEQDFNFGSEIIFKDISKITSLEIKTIKTILDKIDLNDKLNENELLEEEFFKDIVHRKIKKKLIYEIALARIKEISELMIFKNINLNYYKKSSNTVFFEFKNKAKITNLEKIYENVFSANNTLKVEFLHDLSSEVTLSTANKLVHFGWKKEAIPVAHSKKSLISRIFAIIFE